MRSRLFATSIIFLLCASSISLAQDDYKFFDEEGNKIVFPKDAPVYSSKNPGPWKGLETLHEPEVSSHLRKQGLESVRILNVKLPLHSMRGGEKGQIQAIYVFDKDHYIIGYHPFKLGEREAEAEIWINGIINYVAIYVHCTRHGMWYKEFRF